MKSKVAVFFTDVKIFKTKLFFEIYLHHPQLFEIFSAVTDTDDTLRNSSLRIYK